MRAKRNETSVVMARCKRTRKTYGIRIEKRKDGILYCTWAFPLSERAGSHEGYENTKISGAVGFDREYPGCPYCGAKGWTSCGSCNKLTCYDGDGDDFTCTWCGQSGKIKTAETFDLTGGEF